MEEGKSEGKTGGAKVCFPDVDCTADERAVVIKILDNAIEHYERRIDERPGADVAPEE